MAIPNIIDQLWNLHYCIHTPCDSREPGDPSHELVAVGDALDRVTSEPIYSGLDLPVWPRSLERGNAHSSEHTNSATGDKPVPLKVAPLRSERSENWPRDSRLEGGEYASVNAAQLLPQGADAVIRARTYDGHPETDLLSEYLGEPLPGEWENPAIKPIPPGLNVLRAGSDLPSGTLLLDAGTRISPLNQAALAMAGVTHIRVKRTPRIAVVLIGDQFAPLGVPRQPWQSPDGITIMVRSLLHKWGYTQVTLRTIDCRADVRRWHEAASQVAPTLAAEHDLVISVGLIEERATGLLSGSSLNRARIPAPIFDTKSSQPNERGFEYSVQTFRPPQVPGSSSAGNAGIEGSCTVQIRGFPLSVLAAMYIGVKPLLDSMEYLGQLPLRAALKPKPWSRPGEGVQGGGFNPDWPEPTHGVRWMNGMLMNSVPRRHSWQTYLCLARLDHSEPGKVGLWVLPPHQQDPFAVSGLLTAEAMVGIEPGEGEATAGTPVEFFLLD